ncbi:MAG TPA: hypothetical protein VMT53_13255 [Terriglobales bacterium]|nr:hypothetical protein [Terriglobales bacterium]
MTIAQHLRDTQASPDVNEIFYIFFMIFYMNALLALYAGCGYLLCPLSVGDAGGSAASLEKPVRYSGAYRRRPLLKGDVADLLEQTRRDAALYRAKKF